MAEDRKLSEYDQGFIARVRAARSVRYQTQQDFCTAVGIDQDSYKVFETIRVLPPDKYEQYCQAWGVSIAWLVTGKGPGPAVLPLPEKRARRRSPQKHLQPKKAG